MWRSCSINRVRSLLGPRQFCNVACALRDDPEMMQGFLSNGVLVELHLGNFFDCHRRWIKVLGISSVPAVRFSRLRTSATAFLSKALTSFFSCFPRSSASVLISCDLRTGSC